MVGLGVEVQLSRLQEVRSCKDYAAARACYVEERKDAQDYQGIDKAVSRSVSALPATALDEQD